MGRKRKNAVYAYFSYNKETNSSTCLVPGCSSVIKGEHGTNLLYHLSSNHKEFKIVKNRNQLNENESQSRQPNDENDPNVMNRQENDQIPGTSGESTRKRANPRVSYLRDQCVNLVTVHGRPFLLIDDLAFKNILAMTSINPREAQAINSRSIKSSITETAEKVRNDIANEMKGRLISLKIDSATRLDRTFFAVNAQYIKNAEIVIKTLGVAEMWERSTSEHLQETVLFITRKYRLEIDQIYTITSDNGANMLKVTRLLNETAREEESEGDEDSDAEGDEDRLLNVTFEFEDVGPHSITSVRCVAHSLQLAVQDALREDESLPTIGEARNIVRKLRTPLMKNMIKSAKKNKPILDNNTRWHSTLDMLERLKSLRECCSEVPGEPLYLYSTTWDSIDDLIISLKPAKICTKMLQEEQLTPGDFYYYWNKCYLETSHVMTPLAQQICVCMKNRQVFMSSAPFLSALYLDPRFKVVLSDAEEALAVAHINTTWRQILKVEANALPAQESNESSENLSTSADTGGVAEVEDEFEAILSRTERERRCEQRARYVQTRVDISTTLQKISNHPRLPPKEDILLFWKNKGLAEPQLSRLAQTILAVPSTQVSVERLFSSLKYVMNRLRYNLNETIVDDILVIKNNK